MIYISTHLSLKPFITLGRCSNLLQCRLMVWDSRENARDDTRQTQLKFCVCYFLVKWLEHIPKLSGYSLSRSVLSYLIVITMPYLQGHVKTTWNTSQETHHNYCSIGGTDKCDFSQINYHQNSLLDANHAITFNCLFLKNLRPKSYKNSTANTNKPFTIILKIILYVIF